MLKKLLELLLSTKALKTGAKFGGGALSGGALVFVLVNYVNAKDKAARDYVDAKDQVIIAQMEGQTTAIKTSVKSVQTQITNVKIQVVNSESKILRAIEKLDSRIYDMAKQKMKGI